MNNTKTANLSSINLTKTLGAAGLSNDCITVLANVSHSTVIRHAGRYRDHRGVAECLTMRRAPLCRHLVSLNIAVSVVAQCLSVSPAYVRRCQIAA